MRPGGSAPYAHGGPAYQRATLPPYLQLLGLLGSSTDPATRATTDYRGVLPEADISLPAIDSILLPTLLTSLNRPYGAFSDTFNRLEIRNPLVLIFGKGLIASADSRAAGAA